MGMLEDSMKGSVPAILVGAGVALAAPLIAPAITGAGKGVGKGGLRPLAKGVIKGYLAVSD